MTPINRLINAERLKNLFIKMAEVDTGSCEETKTKMGASTKKQVDFAKKFLVKQMKKIGLKDVKLDKTHTVTATLKGNVKADLVLGLIAHMDTSEQAPTGPVKPQIHDYKDGDIELNGVKIDAKDLEPYKNSTIITSDGTTLLGADDKAGIAEILEAVKVLIENPEIKHPTIRIAITPDEEIGEGVTNFDIEKFGANIAYTVDGSEVDNIESETFNAFNPEIIIEGLSRLYSASEISKSTIFLSQFAALTSFKRENPSNNSQFAVPPIAALGNASDKWLAPATS